MSDQIYIEDILLPAADIVEYPKSTEELMFADAQISPEKWKVTIDNTDKTKYDPRVAGSLFYGATAKGMQIEDYNTDFGRTVFKGTIDDLTIEGDRIILEAMSYIGDLSKIDCNYTNGDDKTPAQCIYEILKFIVKVPEENIAYEYFEKAIQVQAAAALFVTIAVSDASAKKCSDIINELQRISHCCIYSYQNLIYLYQYTSYSGQLGDPIDDVAADTYRQSYSVNDPFVIMNSYLIAFDNGGSIDWVEGKVQDSIDKYGEIKFLIPNTNIDSTSSDDFNILIRTKSGAQWSGGMALDRFAYVSQLCSFTEDDKYSFISLGMQADLWFPPFQGEPCLVIGREPDIGNRTIQFNFLFLNTPHQNFVRDVTPPSAPVLLGVYPEERGIAVKFTIDPDSSHLGYKIYFATSLGEWKVEECNWGKSPIDKKAPTYTSDGYIGHLLAQLNPGVRYYIKVTAYDKNRNESSPSNIMSARTADNSPLRLYVQGDIYLSKITLDQANQAMGGIPGAWTKYDDSHYDDVNDELGGMYQSEILYNENGWTSLSWTSAGDSNDIRLQYRTGNTLAAINAASWSGESNAITNTSLSISGLPKYIQYRFLFYSATWWDSDFVYIKGVV